MLKKEYAVYKDKNNLDQYFELFLNDDTRKNTLKLVDELMEEEDWLEKLRRCKTNQEKLNYSDTANKLQEFYDDMM